MFEHGSKCVSEYTTYAIGSIARYTIGSIARYAIGPIARYTIGPIARLAIVALVLSFALLGDALGQEVNITKESNNMLANSDNSTQRDAQLIARKLLFDNPEKVQGRISPNGKWLSWLAPKDGVLNVWIAPLDDSSVAQVITDDKTRGIKNHYWTPDSNFILYHQDFGGNENFHTFVTEIKTGRVRELTPVGEDARALISGLSYQRPDIVLIATNERQKEYSDLYEYNYRSGERTLVAENNEFSGYITDHQLHPRLGTKVTPEGGAIYYRLEANGARSKIFLEIPADDLLTTGFLGFDLAGETLYMIDSRGRDKSALKALNDKTGDSVIIAESDKADITTIDAHPTTYKPLAYVVDRLKPQWFALAPDMADDLDFLEQKFKGAFSIVSKTRDNLKWVVVDDSAESPGVYYLYNRSDARTFTQLFITRPQLAKVELQPMYPLEIKARDGLELVSYLTLPAGHSFDPDRQAKTPVPLLLWVHGGPWARDFYGYNPIHQWMANRGYAVLSVNYRGSTGFGKDHINKAVHEWSGKMHNDLIDAVNWAVNKGITEPGKIAIGGGSYGGYAALVGLTFTPDVFACAVDIVGPSNLVTLIRSVPAYWRPVLGQFHRHIGDPDDPADNKRILAQSPLFHVDAIRTPLLIGQGGNDPRVKKAESDQIVEAMKAKGLTVTYLNYTDEGHGFGRPENRLSFFAVMEGFLAQCLGGDAQPIGDAFEGTSAEVLAGVDGVTGLSDAIAARSQKIDR